MTLAQVNAKIATILADLAATPSKMTPAVLDTLADLNGRRGAMTVLESMPADVRARVATDYVVNITANAGNLRGAEVTATVGALAVYGAAVRQ